MQNSPEIFTVPIPPKSEEEINADKFLQTVYIPASVPCYFFFHQTQYPYDIQAQWPFVSNVMIHEICFIGTECSGQQREIGVTSDQSDQPTIELHKTLAIPKYVGLVDDILVLTFFPEYLRSGGGLVIYSSAPLRAKQSSFVLLLLQIPMV